MIAYRKSISRIIALSLLLMVPSLGTSMQEAQARISIQGSRLQGSNLQGAKIQGSNLQGAKIQGINLQAPVTDGHRLRGPRLIGVRRHVADEARWQPMPCTRPVPGDQRISDSAWLPLGSQSSATPDAWPAD